MGRQAGPGMRSRIDRFLASLGWISGEPTLKAP